MRWWRVQATWTVDGEQRSYAPVFVRTRLGAQRARRDMERTLTHFPTLAVTVDRATDEQRAQEMPQDAPAEPEPVHLKFRNDDPATACGVAADTVTAWSLPALFELAPQDARCPGCAQAHADASREG